MYIPTQTHNTHICLQWRKILKNKNKRKNFGMEKEAKDTQDNTAQTHACTYKNEVKMWHLCRRSKKNRCCSITVTAHSTFQPRYGQSQRFYNAQEEKKNEKKNKKKRKKKLYTCCQVYVPSQCYTWNTLDIASPSVCMCTPTHSKCCIFTIKFVQLTEIDAFTLC